MAIGLFTLSKACNCNKMLPLLYQRNALQHLGEISETYILKLTVASHWVGRQSLGVYIGVPSSFTRPDRTQSDNSLLSAANRKGQGNIDSRITTRYCFIAFGSADRRLLRHCHNVLTTLSKAASKHCPDNNANCVLPRVKLFLPLQFQEARVG